MIVHGFYDFGEFYSNSSKRNQPGGIEEFSAFSLLHAFLNILVLVRNSMHLKRSLVHMNYRLANTAITCIHIKIALRDFLSSSVGMDKHNVHVLWKLL